MKADRQPRVEALLQRALLSVSVVKETLTIEGTAGRDEMVVGVHPLVINLMSVKINGDEKVFLLGSFKVININTLAGDDIVRIGEMYEGHPAFLVINLGEGNDRAYGSAHNETILGGEGNDRIAAAAGNDSVSGGGGNDVLAGDAGDDTLDGLGGRDSLYGGEGKDQLFGGDDADTLSGENGNDAVDGGAGNDRLDEIETIDSYTSGYANTLSGSDGEDYLRVGGLANHSALYGGAGNDYLLAPASQYFPNGSSPYLDGGTGNDKLIGPHSHGNEGNDTIVGIGGNDYPSFSPVNISGGEGDDSLDVSALGSGTVRGSAGNDFILAGNGAVQITGDDGDDRIDATGVNHTINGSAGKDTITANGTVNGDDGDDVLRSASDVLKGFTSGEYDKSACRFDGGAGNDVLLGSWYSDVLSGGGGNDILHGGAGWDQLKGDAGNDILFGGNDLDTLHGGEGDDSLFAGGYQDKNRRDDGKDEAYGEAGKDYFDEQSRWSRTDTSRSDVTRLAMSNSAAFGSMISSGTLRIGNGGWRGSVITSSGVTDYSLINSGGGTITVRPPIVNPPASPVSNDALAFHRNAMVLIGRAGTETGAPDLSMPYLTPAERRSLKGLLVHVPSNWTLSRVGEKTGVVWYQVKAAGGVASVEDALWSATMRDTGLGMMVRDGLETKSMAVSLVGLHGASLVIMDGLPTSTSLSSWAAPQSFGAMKAMVTRAGMSAQIIATGETFSFDRPDQDELDEVRLHGDQRYVYTAQGLRTISANGIGAIFA